jgi:hypothetical protein
MRTVAIVAALLSGSLVTSAQMTIPEKVKKAKAGTHIVITRQISPADLPVLVQSSALVARVIVSSGESRLSANQSEIETDYRVSVVDVYRGAASVAGTVIVVSRPGGRLMIEGQLVTAAEDNFPAFRNGEEYVLFLSRSQSGDIYFVNFGAQGAFLQADGFLEQVYGSVKQERGRQSDDAFIAEVKELSK